MRRLFVPGAVAAAVAVLGFCGWLLLAPGWAVALLQEQAQLKLGRGLEVKGGAHLAFLPELSIRFDQVHLTGPEGQDGAFLVARALRIPVSPGDLFTRSPDLSAITLEGADVAFLVDERGLANWSFAAVPAPAHMQITFEDARLRYFDARNGQSLALAGAKAVAQVGADGSIALDGTAEINGRLARLAASLKSLARVHDDGSPLDLSIESVEGKADFSGRLSTAKALSLAGPVTLSSPDLRGLARWGGIHIAEGDNYRQFSLSGALDSAGRAFAIHRAEVTLDGTQASGEVVVDLRGEVPKLQAALTAQRLVIDPFLPESGAGAGEWGTRPLGFESLRGFDAEMTLETAAFSAGGLSAFPCRLVLALAKGRLQAALTAQSETLGPTSLDVTIDAGITPPAFAMTFKSGNAGSWLAGYADITWLTGTTDFSADVSGTGQTQQEIVGTLKGTASIAASGGSLVGPDMTALLAAVSQRILEGWQDGGPGTTAFTSFAGSFTIADGIATTSDLHLKAPGFSMTAGGEADLLRRAIDLKAEPRLVTEADGATAGLPVAVAVKGPWAAPRIYPDMKGILENPEAGFSTLKTMGLPAGN